MYVFLIAPLIAEHAPPFLSQRSQAYSYLDGLFVQVPFVPVSVEFSCGVPVIAGGPCSRACRRPRRPQSPPTSPSSTRRLGCRHAEPDRVSVVRCGQLVLRAVRSVDRVAAASVGRAAEPGVLVLGRVARPGAALACEHLPDAGGADGPRRRAIGRLRLGRGETGADGRDGNDERRRGGERGPVRPTTPSFENSAHLSPLRFPCERRSRAFVSARRTIKTPANGVHTLRQGSPHPFRRRRGEQIEIRRSD